MYCILIILKIRWMRHLNYTKKLGTKKIIVWSHREGHIFRVAYYFNSIYFL